ncbi:hypothetical protein DERP_011156 [Dermatophagoides pteronyssinus]|uniref:Uncharacterized protein n=1 Tax=Dermatophagoides pteronyssinus TaxID=6956 RepID=A0ABQ8J903_DERPT|nr:hypothetical protein DERP_011156 [Dermatophagoides pteronyssinus]
MVEWMKLSVDEDDRCRYWERNRYRNRVCDLRASAIKRVIESSISPAPFINFNPSVGLVNIDDVCGRDGRVHMRSQGESS